MSKDRIAIVSGGSRGLGAAIVECLLNSGFTVATFSRSSSKQVEQFATGPSAERFSFQQVDITQPKSVDEFVSLVEQRYGRIDALVNNAAVAHDAVFATQDDSSIQQMLNVNLAGTIQLSRACIRRMLLRQSGSIVNIASVASVRGAPGLAVYSATKAAIVGMTRSLARELGPKGIRVNAVAPGYLETEMSASLNDQQRQSIVRRTPLGRLGSVSDVVPCVEFLLSNSASFITGQVISIDGGAAV